MGQVASSGFGDPFWRVDLVAWRDLAWGFWRVDLFAHTVVMSESATLYWQGRLSKVPNKFKKQHLFSTF